jgi:hypothetical protein
MVAADDVLRGIDQIAGIVREIEIAGDAAESRIEAVIGFRIIGVVVRGIDLPLEIGAGIGDVEAAEPALDGERGLGEAVMAAFGEEVLDLEIPDARVVAEETVRMLVLAEQARGHRPMLGELDAQSGAAADDVDIVIIVLGEPIIVDDDAARLRLEGTGAGDIVDIAGVMRVPADDAHRRGVAQRRVDEAFERPADAAMTHGVDLAVDAP